MAAVGAAMAAEVAARRLGPRFLPALPPGETEAAFKLGRLRELARSGQAPRVLIIGASPTGTSLDPAVIASRGVTDRVYSACLTGATVPVLRRWRELWKQEVAPEVILVGAQPLMFVASGRFSEKVTAGVTALEGSYVAPPGAHPLATWRWRRELAGALRGRGGSERYAGSVPGGQVRSLVRRPRPDGFLEAFLDVPLVEGLKTFPDNWFEYMGIDPYAPTDLEPYLAFLAELRAAGTHPIVLIPPLRLSASPSTAVEGELENTVSDQLHKTAKERGFDVIDLRPLVNDDDDFSDMFHVRRAASKRVSEACGDALVRLAPEVRA